MAKQCITYNESKLILDDLRKETDILLEGTDFKIEGLIEKHFYFVEFKKFENYPMFVGKIHEKYGRDIDIRTYYTEGDNISMYIRGLGKELK